MARGSTESSSSSDPEQNQQSDSNSKMITTRVMNTLPQGFSNNIETGSRVQQTTLALPGSSKNKQPADNSLSLQAQSHAGDEDLFTVYMQGIKKSHDQRLSQKNDQVSKSNNVPMPVYGGYMQNASNNAIINNSNLYYPNLPTGFSFPSSSPMFQPRLVGYSSHVPFGNLGEDSTNNVNTFYPNWAPQGYYSDAPMNMDGISSFPLRLIGVDQEIPNNAPSVFNDEIGSSNHVQARTSSSQKRKTTWQEQGEGVPVRKRWQGEVLGQNSRASASDDERYTVYDKRYEEIGLPMDPHLRLFNASKGKDAGRSP